jgi:hypothetical protein
MKTMGLIASICRGHDGQCPFLTVTTEVLVVRRELFPKKYAPLIVALFLGTGALPAGANQQIFTVDQTIAFALQNNGDLKAFR